VLRVYLHVFFERPALACKPAACVNMFTRAPHLKNVFVFLILLMRWWVFVFGSGLCVPTRAQASVA
jgi:hypothetical protein